VFEPKSKRRLLSFGIQQITTDTILRWVIFEILASSQYLFNCHHWLLLRLWLLRAWSRLLLGLRLWCLLGWCLLWLLPLLSFKISNAAILFLSGCSFLFVSYFPATIRRTPNQE